MEFGLKKNNQEQLQPDSLKFFTKEKVIMKNKNPFNYHNSEIATIVDFELILEEKLAKKFNLNIGDPIYVLQSQDSEEFLSPESFIEKNMSRLGLLL